ncbi:MAG: hypothetical protein ACI9EF_003118 [Pseudohongiellaceae bacterium]|jgi:hypothetical protein
MWGLRRFCLGRLRMLKPSLSLGLALALALVAGGCLSVDQRVIDGRDLGSAAPFYPGLHYLYGDAWFAECHVQDLRREGQPGVVMAILSALGLPWVGRVRVSGVTSAVGAAARSPRLAVAGYVGLVSRLGAPLRWLIGGAECLRGRAGGALKRLSASCGWTSRRREVVLDDSNRCRLITRKDCRPLLNTKALG